MSNEFGRMLKVWRDRLGLSQQQLSGISGISTKHISFLENGRSNPTRNMIDRLAACLALSAEDAQLLCEYAGLQEGVRDQVDTETRQALRTMLSAHDPYPGVISNYILQPQMMNQSAFLLLDWLEMELEQFESGLDFALGEHGLLQYMQDTDKTIEVSIRLLQAKSRLLEDNKTFQGYLSRVLQNPKLKAAWEANSGYHGSVVPCVPIHIHKDGLDLSFSMIVSTFGTPRSMGLMETEYQLDFFYPADEKTERWLQGLAKK